MLSDEMSSNYSDELDLRLILGETSPNQPSLAHTGLYSTCRGRDANEMRDSNGSVVVPSRMGRNVFENCSYSDRCVMIVVFTSLSFGIKCVSLCS